MNRRLPLLLLLLAFGCSHPVNNDPISLTTDLGGSGDAATADTAVANSTDADSPDVPTTAADATPDATASPDLGDNRESFGEVWNTYYYLAPEADHPGPKTVELLDDACNPVATVSSDYQLAVCIEGSGKLEDGRVINFSSRCNCGTPCSSGTIICWKALDADTHPWGEGAFGNALVPLRSLAVDRDIIPLRTVIYIEQFDGLVVPTMGDIAGFTHDGCFRADDVGGAIGGDHIDIFAGSTTMWQHLETVFPTRSTLDAFTNVAKCGYLEI